MVKFLKHDVNFSNKQMSRIHNLDGIEQLAITDKVW